MPIAGNGSANCTGLRVLGRTHSCRRHHRAGADEGQDPPAQRIMIELVPFLFAMPKAGKTKAGTLNLDKEVWQWECSSAAGWPVNS
jgi:hypothetical protein